MHSLEQLIELNNFKAKHGIKPDYSKEAATNAAYDRTEKAAAIDALILDCQMISAVYQGPQSGNLNFGQTGVVTFLASDGATAVFRADGNDSESYSVLPRSLWIPTYSRTLQQLIREVK